MQLHSLLNTESNIRRAGVMSLDKLLAAHLDFRSRLPSDWKSYDFEYMDKHHVYVCKTPRNDRHFVSHQGCTCESYQEQLDLQKWLRNEKSIEFAPICKHMVMLEQYITHPKTIGGATLIWDIECDELKSWKSYDNRTFTEHKTIALNLFPEARLKTLRAGWSWVRKSNAGMSKLVSTGKR